MSKTITISAINAQKAYNHAPKEVREAIKTLCAPHNFDQNITEIVKSYEDACEVTGFLPLKIEDFSQYPTEDREYAFANHQLDIIIRALNGVGHVFCYLNENQKKWYPWFVWDEKAAGGSGFSLRNVGYYYSTSIVGARRSFKEEKLCRYAVDQFLSIYNKALKPE